MVLSSVTPYIPNAPEHLGLPCFLLSLVKCPLIDTVLHLIFLNQGKHNCLFFVYNLLFCLQFDLLQFKLICSTPIYILFVEKQNFKLLVQVLNQRLRVNLHVIRSNKHWQLLLGIWARSLFIAWGAIQ